MKKKSDSEERNSLFDFIAAKLEKDQFLSVCLTVLLVIGTMLSLVAGIAVWPVIFDLQVSQSLLGRLAASIWKTGCITTAVCIIVSIILVFCRHQPLKVGSIFVTNLIAVWVVFAMMLIIRQDVIYALQVGVFTGTLLWGIIAFAAGYILAVLPSILITMVVSVIYFITDLILPS